MHFFTFILSIVISATLAVAGDISPIILIPGIGGSQIEARLNPNFVPPYCYVGHSEYFTLWLNMSDAFYRADCFFDDISLHYDKTTRKTSSSPGVQTRIPGFGSCSGVEWVDCNRYNMTRYFIDTISHLTNFGYISDKTIRAAPYDFRRGPAEHEEFFRDFKDLIEDTYTSNGNQKVVLIPHSMGGIMTVAFLRRQSQEWKAKYVRSMISLAGAYGGAVKAVRAVMNGYEMETGNMFLSKPTQGHDFGHFPAFHSMFSYMNLINLQVLEADDNRIKKLFRSFPGVIWLFPSPKAWSKSDVLILGKNKRYTLANLQEYFRDIDFELGWEMYQDAYPAMKDLEHPGVEVHCLYGSEVDTVEQIKCESEDLSDCHGVVQGDGDGTVNLQSLELCTQWKGANLPLVKHFAYPNVTHMGILKDHDVLKYIAEHVTRA